MINQKINQIFSSRRQNVSTNSAVSDDAPVVRLDDRQDTFPDKLSGGEQQRVAIARALVHDPMLVLADEPTGNLDENTGTQVLDLLLSLTRRRGKTLIMATHNPEIAGMADRVVRVHDGKLEDETHLHEVEYA